MTNAQKVLKLIQDHADGLDDDEITEMLGLGQRQQVHQICTRLEAAGQIRRDSVEKTGKRRKIHNFPVHSDALGLSRRSVVPLHEWEKRLNALIAATGQSKESLLDEALQDLAIKELRKQVND